VQNRITVFGVLLLLLNAPLPIRAEVTPAATAGYEAYRTLVESRLSQQHRAPDSFLASTPSPRQDVTIEQLKPPSGNDLPGALLHHWRGTAFAPGAKVADFEHLLRDVNSYPKYFAPQVLQARVTAQDGDHMQTWMRVRQHHVITVVLDADYDVTFGRIDAQHGYSISRSTRISEIDASGNSADHGFLWRLSTYWTYQERDGGLDLQIESVSLTRSIPRGLGWVIRPYIESIPRESLEFTLRSAVAALRNQSH